MIKLLVEPYCQDCDGFEPRVKKTEMLSNYNLCTTSETYVSCEHSRKCARMYEHIKREVSKNEC